MFEALLYHYILQSVARFLRLRAYEIPEPMAWMIAWYSPVLTVSRLTQGV